MLLKQFQVGPMAVYAYLLGCPQTRQAALIDPAGEEDWLVDQAEQAGYRVAAILNTHGHADHIGGNARVKELTGAPILIGAGDADYLSPKYAERCLAFGFTPSPPADRRLGPDEIIELGRLRLRVLATPGHTPGGVCYLVEGQLFTGDTLFVGAVGRTDLPGGSWERLLDSIQAQLLPLPEETVVWPGHAYGPQPSSTVGREKATNPYLTDFLAD